LISGYVIAAAMFKAMTHAIYPYIILAIFTIPTIYNIILLYMVVYSFIPNLSSKIKLVKA
jgi:nitrate reductase gamma subunit